MNTVHITKVPVRQSNAYNNIIRLATMRWAILDQLKNPSHGFEKAIQNHFKSKKNEIIQECTEWTKNTTYKPKEYEKYLHEIVSLL